MAASLSLRRGQTTRVLYELCRDVEHCEYPNESHPRQIAITVQHADGFGDPYDRRRIQAHESPAQDSCVASTARAARVDSRS